MNDNFIITDPVCGMEIDKSTAVQGNYGGEEYYFCSPACREKFLAAPVDYIEDLEEDVE